MNNNFWEMVYTEPTKAKLGIINFITDVWGGTINITCSDLNFIMRLDPEELLGFLTKGIRRLTYYNSVLYWDKGGSLVMEIGRTGYRVYETEKQIEELIDVLFELTILK